jgi:hypothetical protein
MMALFRASAVTSVVLFALAMLLNAQESSVPRPSSTPRRADLCLDGFCIGQGIADVRFDRVDWIVPRNLSTEPCTGVGCKPQIAFRGYPEGDQKSLAAAVSSYYGMWHYNIVSRYTLPALRHYKYECNLSARGIFGERRFFGIYRSTPSG